MIMNKSALKKIIAEEKQKLKENDPYDRDSGVGGGGIALSALMLSPVIYGHLEQIMKEMGVGIIEAAQYMVMHFPQEAAHMVKILLSAGAAGGMIHEENSSGKIKQMKILKSQLKRIIKEEVEKLQQEVGVEGPEVPDVGMRMGDTDPEMRKQDKVPQMMKELEGMLRGHDWTYQYADDYSYWRKGQEQRDSINQMIRQLGSLGAGGEANDLFMQYANKNFPRGGFAQ